MGERAKYADTYLIKQISKDFGISIDELLDGEYKAENNKKYIMIIIIFAILSLILLIVDYFQLLLYWNISIYFIRLAWRKKRYEKENNFTDSNSSEYFSWWVWQLLCI